MSSKTNCCRILDSLGINYSLIEYEWDEHNLDAITVANKIGLIPEKVCKTLVLCGDIIPFFVVVIPGDQELSLKKAAKATGNKSCSMLPLKDLFAITGYIRGGCSAIGMKKHFPTYIEETILLHDLISVSPGQRGLQILINPYDFVHASMASIANLI
jgi:Cys-tRNA(Pro)/Cys-tRNA(Cys) deacylase